MTVKAVTSERLLLAVQRATSLVHQELDCRRKWVLSCKLSEGALGWVSGPIRCDSWAGERSRAKATLMPSMSPVTSALPVSFQELEDSKWGALTAGLGGGRKGKTFFTWPSISSRWHLAWCMHLWHCSGMPLRGKDPLWQNSSLLFWKGGMVWFVFNSKVQKYPIQLCHIPESWGRWGNEVVTCSIFFSSKNKMKG